MMKEKELAQLKENNNLLVKQFRDDTLHHVKVDDVM